MNIEKYEYVSKTNHQAFSFISSGPNGLIKKIVSFREMKEWGKHFYNLGLGDWDEAKQIVNDQVTCNNGDREKVLATVAAITLTFSGHFPEAFIYIKGSTKSRTRLYQMRIAGYYIQIGKIYEVYGFRNERWEEFRPEINFESFLLLPRK